MREIRIDTRGSPQALWQANWAGQSVSRAFPQSRISTVENLVKMYAEKMGLKLLFAGMAIVAIGLITANTRRRNGIIPSFVPYFFSIEALTEAIVDYVVGKKLPPFRTARALRGCWRLISPPFVP